MKIIAVVVAMILIVALFSMCDSGESQYEKDSRSWIGKTPSEMTTGEKRAANNFYEWLDEEY